MGLGLHFLAELIITNPDEFINQISKFEELFSTDFANKLDKIDPLKLGDLFQFGSSTPFASHSLGPVFQPAIDALLKAEELRKERLHDSHFVQTKEIGGNWFDCDIEEEAIQAAQEILGFAKPGIYLHPDRLIR